MELNDAHPQQCPEQCHGYPRSHFCSDQSYLSSGDRSWNWWRGMLEAMRAEFHSGKAFPCLPLLMPPSFRVTCENMLILAQDEAILDTSTLCKLVLLLVLPLEDKRVAMNVAFPKHWSVCCPHERFSEVEHIVLTIQYCRWTIWHLWQALLRRLGVDSEKN